MKPIALVGMMGSGKTTVGRLLAGELDLEFIDTDEWVEAAAKKSIADLIKSEGEAEFRRLEQEVLADVLAAPCVVATGGGIVLSETNRAFLRDKAQVVYLQAEAEVLIARLEELGEGLAARPLLHGAPLRERILELLSERENLYKDAAHHSVVQQAGEMPKEIMQKVRSLVLP